MRRHFVPASQSAARNFKTLQPLDGSGHKEQLLNKNKPKLQFVKRYGVQSPIPAWVAGDVGSFLILIY
jgi:hypothetical protein